jgi:EmrB/QacA subfamily drug resistance transporter
VSRPPGRDARRGRLLLLASVLAGTFLGTVNNSVANVAVVDLLDEYDLEVGAAVWFVTGYVLAFAVLMPAAGRIADVIGSRRLYIGGLMAFTLASVAVAVAPSFPFAVGARVLQGVANAPVLPTVMVTLAASFPEGERGRAVGAWASVNGAAIAIGPPLGGVITDTLGWRAIFWLDVPITLVAIVLAYRYLPDVRPRSAGRIDVAGGALLTGGLLALMLGLSLGPSRGWTPAVLSVLAVGAMLVVAAWRQAQRTPHPFIDVEVIRSGSYRVLSAVAGLQMAALYGVLFTTPLLLVGIFGRSLGSTGAITFVLPVTMMLAAPAAGALVHRLGTRVLTRRGSLLLVLGAAILGAAAHVESILLVLLGLVVFGAGVSVIQSPTTTAVSQEVDERHRGVALGLFHTVRFLTGVLGTATCAAVFTAIVGGTGIAGARPDRLGDAFVAAFAVVCVLGAATAVLAQRIPAHARAEPRPFDIEPA